MAWSRLRRANGRRYHVHRFFAFSFKRHTVDNSNVLMRHKNWVASIRRCRRLRQGKFDHFCSHRGQRNPRLYRVDSEKRLRPGPCQLRSAFQLRGNFRAFKQIIKDLLPPKYRPQISLWLNQHCCVPPFFHLGSSRSATARRRATCNSRLPRNRWFDTYNWPAHLLIAVLINCSRSTVNSRFYDDNVHIKLERSSLYVMALASRSCSILRQA